MGSSYRATRSRVNRREKLKALKQPKLLILDEIGYLPPGATGAKRLRHNGHLPTVGAEASAKGGKPMNNSSAGSRLSHWVGLMMLASGTMMAQIVPNLPAPTNLLASAVSPTQINLTWTWRTSEDFNVLGSIFKMERCGGVGCANFTEIAQVGAGRPIVGYTNTGLTPNTNYRYRVRAAKRMSQSPYSIIAQASTHPPHGPDLVVHFNNWVGSCSYEDQENCLTACPYVTHSIGIKNQGDVSPSGQVSFNIRYNNQSLHTWTVPIPAAGETKVIGWYKDYPWRCPGDPTVIGSQPPNYFFTVDSQNVLAEGNEQNNNTGTWIKRPEMTSFGQN
jgi:CARDB protein/fibronectin type III domain protein